MLTTLLAKWNSRTDLNLTYIVLHKYSRGFWYTSLFVLSKTGYI